MSRKNTSDIKAFMLRVNLSMMLVFTKAYKQHYALYLKMKMSERSINFHISFAACIFPETMIEYN